MPLSDPSLRELGDHEVSWCVLQSVSKDRLQALAEGERAKISELALGLMGCPRAVNPHVPVAMRLRGSGLSRCYARRLHREREGQCDRSEVSYIAPKSGLEMIRSNE